MNSVDKSIAEKQQKMFMKRMIEKLSVDLHDEKVVDADQTVTHIMARIKYPTQLYQCAMILKGQLKKMIGPNQKPTQPLMANAHQGFMQMMSCIQQMQKNHQSAVKDPPKAF